MSHQTIRFDLSKPKDRGQFLRNVMLDRALSSSDLADHIQVSKATVSAVLNGKKQSRRVVRAMATYLKLDPDIFYPEAPDETSSSE